MKSPSNDAKDTPAETAVRHNLAFPLIALGLSLLPFLVNFLLSSGVNVPGYFLFAIMAPLAGLVTGFMALQDKEGIGPMGTVIARIAIAIPLAFIAFIVFGFIGVATGLISLM